MSESQKPYFCPRLLDYLCIVGSRNPNRNNTVTQTPEMLRRYPREDHKDFKLAPDVVFFCQPEGCVSVGPKRMSFRDTTSFVFTLTEKDSGRRRYGICVNFYRPFERKSQNERPLPLRSESSASSNSEHSLNNPSFDSLKSPRGRKRTRIRNHSLTSLCIISHHPFFSTFRECLFTLRRIIDACNDRSGSKRIGGSRTSLRDSVWGVLFGKASENVIPLVMHDVREIEAWILRLLSAPVPVPGATRVELSLLPKEIEAPLIFSLPDHTRFSLVDFPLHLPLELLGVDTCLKVLECIILEHKVSTLIEATGIYSISTGFNDKLSLSSELDSKKIVLQSRDYNALSMSVMAFISMLYPLEYMFPVIPLLPTCMSSAEQLLLAPTPYIIGVPASFLLYKKHFQVPDDVWLVDLDSNKITPPRTGDNMPALPEPEGTVLKNHLRQALASMSMSPQPIKNLDTIVENPEVLPRQDSFPGMTAGFNPLIFGNDVDAVDIATRVAMVRFFNSQNILGNFNEHTRTLRLYPRPVVGFQMSSFMKSRPIKSVFTHRLARTQAVEYFAEWSLTPQNVVFTRIHTGVFDPSLIGDKPKWFCHTLQPIHFQVCDTNTTLTAAITSVTESVLSDEVPTDESGSDSDGAESTSSSYSSLSDFVTDMMNSDLNGETPDVFNGEQQMLTIDESQFYQPPKDLQVPDRPLSRCSSSSSPCDDSDADSSDSENPPFVKDSGETTPQNRNTDSENFTFDSSESESPSRSVTLTDTTSRDSGISMRSLNSAFEQYHRRVSDSGSRTQKSNGMPPKTDVKNGMQSQPGMRQRILSAGSDSSSGSVISSLSSELGEYTSKASKTISSFLSTPTSETRTTTPSPTRQSRPYAPLGTRRTALIEKSGLVKHHNTHPKKLKDVQRQQSIEARNTTHSENQQFLKEVISHVLDGKGIGLLKYNKLRRLMEDENYRNFVVSRLNTSLDKKFNDDFMHIEDVQTMNKHVYKGMLNVLKYLIYGLEHTYKNHGLGGMASALMVLEIAHTHFWAKVTSSGSSTRSNSSSRTSSPFGSRESLNNISRESSPSVEQKSFPGTTHSWRNGSSLGSELRQDSSQKDTSPTRSDENSNKMKNGKQCNIIPTNPDTRTLSPHDSDAQSEDGEMLHQLVKHKELIRADQDLSDQSPSSHSDADQETPERRKSQIKHHAINSSVSDPETDHIKQKTWFGHINSAISHYSKTIPVPAPAQAVWNNKSSISSGFRYHAGKLINTATDPALPTPDALGRVYLFEGLIDKNRSKLWDQMQFWEDAFLDAVAQERDIIGLDQGPREMMDRYNSLGTDEKKRLEHDEDRLLSTMLYNMVSFMVMMKVNKTELKRKIRRLLGKSHIGLVYSQEVNNLLDSLQNLEGNDIDLKPVGSRLMQKQSFSVHWGTDNSGDMLFMEVCDDCIILRSVMGVICDRWWYDQLVNMTYCPKTKVLCLWRKQNDTTQLNKFYTKKCRELYFCVKEAMEKAAAKNHGKLPGPELGGEFPVQDLKTGEGGLLQVCMEGIGLLFANSKFFVELSRIKKCFTQKGGIFVLEEFDPQTRHVISRRYKSNMADQICYAVLCVFSYVAAGMEQRQLDSTRNASLHSS